MHVLVSYIRGLVQSIFILGNYTNIRYYLYTYMYGIIHVGSTLKLLLIYITMYSAHLLPTYVLAYLSIFHEYLPQYVVRTSYNI